MSSKIARRQLREMMAAAPVCLFDWVSIVRELTRRMHGRACARALSLTQLVPQADKGAGKGRETAAAKSKPAQKMSKVLLSLAALCSASGLGSLSSVHSA